MEGWRTLAEAIGVAAVVASLIFVGLQMRQAEQLTAAQLAVSLAGPSQELRATITDHAGVWRRGNAGESLDPDEEVIYKELLQATWNLAFWESYSYRLLGGSRDVSAHRFAVFLFDNPGARRTWLAERDHINGRRELLGKDIPVNLQEIVMKDLEVLDSKVATAVRTATDE